MNLSDGIQFTGIIITFFGLIYVVISNRKQIEFYNKQLRMTSFSDYTKRYQELQLKLPSNINSETFDLDKLTSSNRENTLRYIKAYIDLCSEEYYLWQNGYLNDNVWREWKSGILFALSKPAFHKALKIIDPDSKFYTDFQIWIDEYIEDKD